LGVPNYVHRSASEDRKVPRYDWAIGSLPELTLSHALGANVIVWGIVLIFQGVTTSFGAFFVLRFLLGALRNNLRPRVQVLKLGSGMLESCVGSILILLIAMFYKKSEQVGLDSVQARVLVYLLMKNKGPKDGLVLLDGALQSFMSDTELDISTKIGLTSVFGGFSAYGIVSTGCMRNYSVIFDISHQSFYSGHALIPYKIVYFLQGGLAIIVGISVLIWMPDSPVHAHFLTREERVAALERVRDDQGGTENKTFKLDQAVEALTDVRTWLIVLTNIVTMIPNGSLGSCECLSHGFGLQFLTFGQSVILSLGCVWL